MTEEHVSISKETLRIAFIEWYSQPYSEWEESSSEEKKAVMSANYLWEKILTLKNKKDKA